MQELAAGKEISITTYREGDRADTGHRREIKNLGFAEAELLVEFGYPPSVLSCQRRDPMHPFPDETAHLAEILQKLDAALQEADADVERIDTRL